MTPPVLSSPDGRPRPGARGHRAPPRTRFGGDAPRPLAVGRSVRGFRALL